MLFDIAVSTVLLPAFVSFAIGILVLRPWLRPEQRVYGTHFWGYGLAVASGYVAAHGGINGVELNPVSATDWLPHVAGVAGLLAILEYAIERRSAIWIGRATAIAGALYFVIGFKFRQWSGVELGLWMGGLVLIGLLWIGVFEAVSRRYRGFWVPLFAIVISSGASGVFVFSQTAQMGQLAGGLTSAVGALFVVGLWNAKAPVGRGAGSAFVVLLLSIFSNTYFLVVDPPVWGAAAFAAAIPLALVIPFGSVLEGGTEKIARVVALGIATGLAVVLTVSPPELFGTGEEGDTSNSNYGDVYD